MRETDLHDVAVGDCATVYSMLDRTKPIKGAVIGVGWGVLDDDRINLPRNVPYVRPSVNWVRVAHRFPVRIKLEERLEERLEETPQALVRLGASASVEVRHGAACR
jgi:multidrug efflux system membrane fusion protein